MRRNKAGASGYGAGHGIEPTHPLERLIFFSDAVFAIAITLLVIEIPIPHLPPGASDGEQLRQLARLTPNFIGFLVSFGVIGAFWAGHHRAFSQARHWSPTLLFPNLALLCLVAFMPFATAYMNANIGQRVPTAFYDAVLLATGLLNIRLVRRATSAPVVDEGADPKLLRVIRARGWGVTLGAGLALVVSLVDARWSQMALITIPLWLRLAVARARRPAAA